MGEQRGKEEVKIRKWTKEELIAVMKCYYRSEPRVLGYRRRLHQLWSERELFDASEQRLSDQVRAILKNKWISEIELEEIRRLATVTEDEINDEDGLNVADDVNSNDGMISEMSGCGYERVSENGSELLMEMSKILN